MLHITYKDTTVIATLSGMIGVDVVLEDVKELIAIAENYENVKLQINSEGGYVFEGYAMFNLLNQIKEKLDVEIIGLAASIASLLALSGRSLVIYPGSYIMIHNPYISLSGDANEMRKQAEILDSIKQDMIKIYSAHSYLMEAEIAIMMDNETWISAEQARDYGFIQTLDESILPIAACINTTFCNYKNIPSELKKEIVTNSIEGFLETQNNININEEVKNMDVDKIVNDISEKIMNKISTVASLTPNSGEVESDDLRGFKNYLIDKKPMNATVKTSDGYGVPTLADSEAFKRRSTGSFIRKDIEGVSPAHIRKYGADTKVTAKVNPTAAIIAEGADYANGSDAGTVVTFDSIKMGSIYSVTEEISEETVMDVIADFSDDAGKALAKLENQYFVTGSGIGEPQGMVTGGTLYQDATGGLTTSGFSADAKAYATLVTFDEKLPEEYREGAFYMMNSATRAALRGLVDSNNRPILNEYSDGLYTLFGKPIIINNNMDTFGVSKKVILLGNRDGYGVGDRLSGMKVRVSENTSNGDTEVRWSVRTDGKVLDATAFQVLQCPAV